MITSDFHMHTNFSIDSNISPRDMIEGALAKGLTTIWFPFRFRQIFSGTGGAQGRICG